MRGKDLGLFPLVDVGIDFLVDEAANGLAKQLMGLGKARARNRPFLLASTASTAIGKLPKNEIQVRLYLRRNGYAREEEENEEGGG